MKKILLPQRAWVTPKEVLEEVNKFEHINKSPYSKTYYNAPGITWEYKPEGSLRISDHWNFKSHGEKHCILDCTEELVQNNWILAQYKEGKYHLIKEFGPNVRGYRFIDIDKNQLALLKALYNMGGLVKSKLWYKEYKVRPILAKEIHIKNRKDLLKSVDAERVKKFKAENREVKKLVYLSDEYMDMIKVALYLSEKGTQLEELCKGDDGVEELKRLYKVCEINSDDFESLEKVYFVVLDNGSAIEFTEADLILTLSKLN